MSKESRARQQARWDDMTDEQLANVAATLVWIALGPRALRALATVIMLQRRDDR